MNTKQANKCEKRNNVKVDTLLYFEWAEDFHTLYGGKWEMKLLIMVSVSENNDVCILNSGRTLPCYLCGVKNITGIFLKKGLFYKFSNILIFLCKLQFISKYSFWAAEFPQCLNALVASPADPSYIPTATVLPPNHL